MTADLEYFRLCRRTDPTYTMYHAYKEYLYENSDEAEEIAQQYWENNSYDDEVFDWGYLEEYLKGIDSEEAFRAGVFAKGYGDDREFNYSAPYFRFNGYGNIESIEDYDYDDIIMDAALDAFDGVSDGDYSISDELEEVLRIFGYDGGEDDDDDVPSFNKKSQARKNSPRKIVKKKPVAKKPVKKAVAKKVAKAPVKKITAKKPAVRRHR